MTQTIGALAVVVVSLSLQLKHQPAAAPVLNKMDEYSLLVLVATFAIGFLLFASKQERLWPTQPWHI